MTKIRFTYRFIAVLMAFLMLFTSLGLSVDMHICQGHLKSFNFFGKAKSCYELADADSMKECTANQHKKLIKKADGCSLKQADCCQNRLLQLISDQDQEVESNHFAISQPLQTFVVAFVAVFLNETTVETDVANHVSYIPPLIQKDIYVLLETFLL